MSYVINSNKLSLPPSPSGHGLQRGRSDVGEVLLLSIFFFLKINENDFSLPLLSMFLHAKMRCERLSGF